MTIDTVARALWARAVNVTLPRPRPDAAARARRLLFLRHDAIGDMLSSLGVIRALAAHGHEVDVLASPENAPVLAANEWGVRVLVTERRGKPGRALPAQLASRRYDAVIDGLVLKPSVNTRTVRLLRLSRAPMRVGTAGRTHDFLYTHPVVTDLGGNHVEVLAALLAPFGISPAEALDPVPMPLTAAERSGAEAWWHAGGAGRRLFVNLSASSAERRWPDAKFVEALRAIGAEEPAVRIAISAGPSEWDAAESVAGAVGGRAVRGSLREAFALLAGAGLVLTPDTSVAHAASGFGVPSVVLTPHGNLRFAPWRSLSRLVVAPGRSIEGVEVAAVLEAVRELEGVRSTA